jgi:integrase
VLTAKQKKPVLRDVPMLPVLAAAMKERMETARAYDPVGYKNALVFGAGTALKRHQCRLITRAINILGFNVGEKENLCLHSLRHSFASENLRTGKIPLQTMKELLGHSSINTTMIYAHNIPAESIARVLEIPSPV